MKRKLAALIATPLLAVTLAACGTNEDNNEIIAEYTDGWTKDLDPKWIDACSASIAISGPEADCASRYTQLSAKAGQLRDRLTETDSILITQLDRITALDLPVVCATPNLDETAGRNACKAAFYELSGIGPDVLAALPTD